MNKRATAFLVAGAVFMWSWALLSAQDGGFRFRGLLSRVITPNGDHVNDVAIFCVDNPGRSGVEGRIFTLLGAEVSSLSSSSPLPAGSLCPADSVVAGGAEFLSWDGTSGGRAVRSGIYIYRIKAEGRTFTGSLVVVR